MPLYSTFTTKLEGPFQNARSLPPTKALPQVSSALISNQTPAHSSKPGLCPPPCLHHHLIEPLCAGFCTAPQPSPLLCHRAFAHLFPCFPNQVPQALSRLHPLVLRLLHKCDFLRKALPLLSHQTSFLVIPSHGTSRGGCTLICIAVGLVFALLIRL